MENGPNSKYNYNYYLVPLHISVVFLQFYPPGSGSPYWTRIRIQEGKWKRIHSPIKPTSLVGGVWCLLAPVLPLPVSQLGQDLVQIRPVGEPADHRERENKCYWRRTAWSGYRFGLWPDIWPGVTTTHRPQQCHEICNHHTGHLTYSG